LTHAQTKHPDLIASQARLASLAASRDRLERETFPKLGLYAGVDAAPKSPVYGVLGISGEIPVAQRNQGPRAVVARATESEQTRREILRRRIAREITAAWGSHERRRTELEVLTRAALPAAERSFELAEAGWKAGRFDWFRVALAARDLIEVRQQRVEALAALWIQRLTLARARGGDVP
jgi:outer membrane protein TolC